ncbi:hypothetical protein MSIBF_A2020034 [groundwater metagenome]|uniref:Uncharacterized protein n=1 Tax=groundwater metagenome TaxID=717931 RepID=A0A098E872_9ZZZZ
MNMLTEVLRFNVLVIKLPINGQSIKQKKLKFISVNFSKRKT